MNFRKLLPRVCVLLWIVIPASMSFARQAVSDEEAAHKFDRIIDTGNSHPAFHSDIPKPPPGAVSGLLQRAQKKMREVQNTAEALCFPAGTLVKTPDGWKKIEDVEEDESIITQDAGGCHEGIVAETFESETSELIQIRTPHDIREATPNHPFYVVERGEFIPARDIAPGEHLLTLGGDKIEVQGSEVRVLASPIRVYNIKVETYQSYFVTVDGTADAVWVHNCNGVSCINQAIRQDPGVVGTALYLGVTQPLQVRQQC